MTGAGRRASYRKRDACEWREFLVAEWAGAHMGVMALASGSTPSCNGNNLGHGLFGSANPQRLVLKDKAPFSGKWFMSASTQGC